MTGHVPGRLTRCIVRVLLAFYPTAFRTKYAAEIEESFGRLVQTRRQSGPIAGAFAWVGGLADIVRGAVRERGIARRLTAGSPHGPKGTGNDRSRGVWQDVRYASRQLVRQPLFTLVAAGSLAIGIGANTAVFSVGNALLFRPLPGITNYARVVDLGRTSSGRGFDTFSYPDFVDIRAEVPALADAAGYQFSNVSVSRGGEGIRALGFHVSASYFTLLGAEPGVGRYFLPGEDVGVEQHPVAILSHHFWSERLGSDPDALGSTIRVNRIPYTVVGITNEAFRGHMVGFVPDLYMPMMQLPAMNGGQNDFEARNASWLLAVGLLADGATVDQLNGQLDALAERLSAAYPDTNRTRGFRAMSIGPIPGAGRAGVRLFIGALLGMVLLILLVTCTNLAGMFLARAISREREFAVRISLGAGRGTLIRLLGIETLLLFFLGGGAGVAFGIWTVGLIRPEVLPSPIPLRFAISPDTTVLGFSVALTLLTGLVFGLLPAARATRLELASSMKDGGTAGRPRSGRLRRAFAGTQVGLSLILLAAASLFVRSLQGAASVDTGFDPDGAHVTLLDLSLEGYDEDSGLRFQDDLLESLRALPWVEDAAASSDLPLDLGRHGTSVRPQGWDEAEDAPLLSVDFNLVSAGYFETLRIPLRAGRTFQEDDRKDTPLVAVVSERFAQEAWPGENPIGRTLRFGARSLDVPLREVVGVVADTKNQVITEAPRAFVYLPLEQRYSSAVQITVRSEGASETAQRGLREAILRADPSMSIGLVAPLDQYTSLGTLPQRIAATLTTGLAGVALLLSGLGIYGVVSYSVSRRRQEIGVRMALGANRRAVSARFLLSGVRLAAPGLVVGTALSLLVGRALQSLLLELSPYDPWVLGGVGSTLLLVVTVAAWIPARRAARVDPAESLRRE